MFCYKTLKERDNKKRVYIWLKISLTVVIEVLISAKNGL